MVSGSTTSPVHPHAGLSAIKRGRSLAAVVLLAGSVRPSELQRAAGRPILDLPLTSGRTVGREWVRRVGEFHRGIEREDLPLCITANAAAGSPRSLPTPDAPGDGPVPTVRMDTEEPRGSGGALRDLAMDLDPAARLFVASGHTLPRTTLAEVFATLARFDDDIVIHTDDQARPTGVFLIRCGSLRGLPPRGFVDLKEQALPQLASSFRVRVVQDPSLPPIPIRTLHGYLSAVREAATPATSPASGRPMPAEDWMCTFALSEPGATVDASARLHDSVVLAGATVRSRASVVRSLIGPGGTVAAGGSVFDELLPRGEHRK